MSNRWLSPHTPICLVGALALAIGVASALEVTKEGYQSASVEITRSTKSPVEFDLQPVTPK